MGRNIGNLSNIKTTQKAKLRSRPKVGDSNYLDLYILDKEKARLEQEKSVVDKRKEQIEVNLKDIHCQIETLEKTAPQGGRQSKSKKPLKKAVSKKEWETMTLDY